MKFDNTIALTAEYRNRAISSTAGAVTRKN